MVIGGPAETLCTSDWDSNPAKTHGLEAQVLDISSQTIERQSDK